MDSRRITSRQLYRSQFLDLARNPPQANAALPAVDQADAVRLAAALGLDAMAAEQAGQPSGPPFKVGVVCKRGLMTVGQSTH